MEAVCLTIGIVGNVLLEKIWFCHRRYGNQLYDLVNDEFHPTLEKGSPYYEVLKWLNTANRMGLIQILLLRVIPFPMPRQPPFSNFGKLLQCLQ